MTDIELPWPPAALRPNASSPGNWRRKFAAAKKYRADCLVLCRAAKLRWPSNASGLDIVFHPPDRRRRDLDNMLASFKVGVDAVAEAIGVDDSIFKLSIAIAEPVKHGKIVVRIEG